MLAFVRKDSRDRQAARRYFDEKRKFYAVYPDHDMFFNQYCLKPFISFMEPKLIRYFFIALCLFAFAANHVSSSVALGRKDLVRVAVLTDTKEFDLSVRGGYRILDPLTNGAIDRGKRLKRCRIAVEQNEILIAEKEKGVRRLRVVTDKDIAIYWDGKKKSYRDQLDIVLTQKGDLLVINTLDLESYVKGVLYHEVPHRWPMNAIMAQAVATRTYALYRIGERGDQPYDVTSGIYSQVYGGRSAERYRTNIAADRTRGQILSYNGEILPAYFHSNCGGRTEDVAELWKNDLPPLKGVECGFCAGMPSYRWKKNFRSKDIQEKLNAKGFKLGLIKEIAIVDRTKSGRIKNLKITTRAGASVMVPGIKFREIIGPNVLRSNLYEIEMKGYYFDVIGRGWGHGVGMCQWGAYRMAKKRHNYAGILKHYYPGAKIIKVTEL